MRVLASRMPPCHRARVLIRRNQVGDNGLDVLDGALVVCKWTNKGRWTIVRFPSVSANYIYVWGIQKWEGVRSGQTRSGASS